MKLLKDGHFTVCMSRLGFHGKTCMHPLSMHVRPPISLPGSRPAMAQEPCMEPGIVTVSAVDSDQTLWL
jgi:hypothetical protein